MTNHEINGAENYTAEVVAHSISEFEQRIVSIEVNMPRMILAELNTHRVFSRNSASSRAIPTHKLLREILENPYIPVEWGKYQSGMSAGEHLSPANQEKSEEIWLRMRDQAALGVVALMGGLESEQLNVDGSGDLIDSLSNLQDQYSYDDHLDGEALHKQWVNRPLEPFMWHRVLVTATEWANFYALRLSEDAQPETRVAAEMMRSALDDSTPRQVAEGDYHLPYIQPDEVDEPLEKRIKLSCARSARLSYMTHAKKRDHNKDLSMYDELLKNGHMSPFEHAATPFTSNDIKFISLVQKLEEGDVPQFIDDGLPFHGNFRGWHPHRKALPHENNFAKVLEELAA